MLRIQFPFFDELTRQTLVPWKVPANSTEGTAKINIQKMGGGIQYFWSLYYSTISAKQCLWSDAKYSWGAFQLQPHLPAWPVGVTNRTNHSSGDFPGQTDHLGGGSTVPFLPVGKEWRLPLVKYLHFQPNCQVSTHIINITHSLCRRQSNPFHCLTQTNRLQRRLITQTYWPIKLPDQSPFIPLTVYLLLEVIWARDNSGTAGTYSWTIL